MSPANPKPHSDLQSAYQWAHNYLHNPNSRSPKDNSINIFWVAIVLLLLGVAMWWWWINYKSKTPAKETQKVSSPMEDLKQGAKKPTGRFIVKPDGTVISE